MPTSAVPSNDNRPASFDQALVDYLPGLHAVAIRAYPNEESDELVSDTIEYALSHWQSQRPGVTMLTWLRQVMSFMRARRRIAASAQKRAGVTVPLDDSMASVSPDDTNTALRQAVDPLPERSRAIVLMQAAGYTLNEIGIAHGLTRERIRQISRRAVEAMRRDRCQANDNWDRRCAA